MQHTSGTDAQIRYQIEKFRTELTAAARILSGPYLVEFRTMVGDIAKICGLEVTETGSFRKLDPEDASPKQVRVEVGKFYWVVTTRNSFRQVEIAKASPDGIALVVPHEGAEIVEVLTEIRPPRVT